MRTIVWGTIPFGSIDGGVLGDVVGVSTLSISEAPSRASRSCGSPLGARDQAQETAGDDRGKLARFKSRSRDTGRKKRMPPNLAYRKTYTRSKRPSAPLGYLGHDSSF